MSDTCQIDTRGLRCPLPVLKARKALAGLPSGGMLTLWADDPIAVIDIPHFCTESGHSLIDVQEHDGAQLYLIRRK
ncbi:MAG: sulfurtransferase TusA family protein [Rhodobacteraceae bacterium]|nr:sulfurtransferase TusA family protein [Paracoccaceae bacterium]